MGFGRLIWDSAKTGVDISAWGGKKLYQAGKSVKNSLTSKADSLKENWQKTKDFVKGDNFTRGYMISESYENGGLAKHVVDGARQLRNAAWKGATLPVRPVILANKGITKMQHGYDAVKGGWKKYQGSSDALKAATTVGVGYGAYRMDDALQSHFSNQAEQAMNNMNYKNASIHDNLDSMPLRPSVRLSDEFKKTSRVVVPLRGVSFNLGTKMELTEALAKTSSNETQKGRYVQDELRKNIPADTSTPSSNSPEDYADYYDYQEWVNTKGNNYPERDETEINMFDNPHKVAHAMGANVYVVNAIDEYLGKRPKLASVVENGIKYTDSEYKRGSKLLAAAVLGGAVAIPAAIANAAVYSGETQTPWHPEYYRL